MDTYVTEVSVHGLKLKLDHTYPENWFPSLFPRLNYVWTHLSLIFRYLLKYFISTVLFRRPLVVDLLNHVKGKGIYGVPIGGIGFTIGRGFRGEFCRYHLKPGQCSYATVEANEFIVTIKDAADITIFQSTLSTYKYLFDYIISAIIFRRSLVLDLLNQVRNKQIYGVPIGGIGSTIGRGFRGEFCRYHLKPGTCSYTTVEANEFIVTIKDTADITLFQSTLSTYNFKIDHLAATAPKPVQIQGVTGSYKLGLKIPVRANNFDFK